MRPPPTPRLPADADYLAAFQHVFLPIAYEFSPDLIIVAAGYDAADGDPMGGCHVSSAGFAHMTALLKAVAPLAVVLEGGYNLAATAAGVEATLRVLLGEQPPKLPRGPLSLPSRTAMMTISQAISVQVRSTRDGPKSRAGPCLPPGASVAGVLKGLAWQAAALLPSLPRLRASCSSSVVAHADFSLGYRQAAAAAALCD